MTGVQTCALPIWIKDAELHSIEKISDGRYYIKGDNFTQSAFLEVNGELSETNFIDEQTLLVLDVQIADGDIVDVAIRSNSSTHKVLTRTQKYYYQEFRDQSVEIIRKQPYILCSVKGFGFLTVDAIARQCCAATNDPMRISGCVSYVLREAMKQNGHLYLEQEILVKDALKVLNKELNLQPVTETEILKVLYRLVMQDSIVVEENRVYITQQHQEEEDRSGRAHV